MSCLSVSEERISNLLETVKYITNNPYISARTLAKLAGKIISTKFVLGDITQLKTRFIYQCIEYRVSWDKKFNINNYNKMVEEILFWKFNITKLNKKSFYGYEIPHLFIYSEVSNTGLTSVYKENGKLNMRKKNFRGFCNPSSRKLYHFVSIKLTANQEVLASHSKVNLCHHDPCNSELVNYVLEGTKRISYHTPKKEKPFTPHILHPLYRLLDKDNMNLINLRTKFLCVLSFMGF